MTPAAVAEIGRELLDARATVPCAQVRPLRILAVFFRSYKAVDCMVLLLSTEEVVSAVCIAQAVFDMLMHLVGVCRLLFRPRPLSMEELGAAEAGLTRSCPDDHALVYRSEETRLAALLDIFPNIRSCGPIWTLWQRSGSLARCQGLSDHDQVLVQVSLSRFCASIKRS